MKNGKLSKEEEKLYFARRIIAYYVFHPIEKKSETAKKGEKKNLKNRNNKKNINNPPLMKGNFNIEGNKYSVIMFYLYYYYVVGAGKCFAAGFFGKCNVIMKGEKLLLDELMWKKRQKRKT